MKERIRWSVRVSTSTFPKTNMVWVGREEKKEDEYTWRDTVPLVPLWVAAI